MKIATIVRKHRAPKGALRRSSPHRTCGTHSASESTERQKVHQDLSVTTVKMKTGLRQKAPSATRCIKTCRRSCTGTGRSHVVRKHRVPNGALRLKFMEYLLSFLHERQKAPSTKRCIKTGLPPRDSCGRYCARQKAPSTKRCIKTTNDFAFATKFASSQKAPSTKRCIKTRLLPRPPRSCDRVRKHRAPKGALRLAHFAFSLNYTHPCQKAPSAKRCIKTQSSAMMSKNDLPVRKHRTPKGALRLAVDVGVNGRAVRQSESTERQKAN